MVLSRLLPQKTEFFDLFSQHAACSVEGARLLRDFLGSTAAAEEKARAIRQVEHKADEICQRTMEMLHRSFITPIDRADIHRISTRIDDIMDHIESTSQRIWLYEVGESTQEVREMAEHLVAATTATKAVVDALAARRDAQAIRKLCADVKAAEKENDRLLRRATARMFREEQDPKNLIKWKEIYDDLESAFDCCDDVANVVEGVVLENA
jgi:predicted phosphate transport protein (TIGR00153 family)